MNSKTCGNYKELCVCMFGEDSEATKFIQNKIDKYGKDELVLADESQVMHVLFSLHFKHKNILNNKDMNLGE
jgi:hypothetical protein